MNGVFKFWRRNSILSALILLMVLFEILAQYFVGESFLSARNLTNLSLQVAINGILAIGMTLIILTGGIDLSVGSTVALTGIVLGLLDRGEWPLAVVISGAVGAGLLIGMVNGFLISRFAIAPFVITLGMLVIARGAALILSDASAIAPLSDGIRFIGSGFLPAAFSLVTVAIGLRVLTVKSEDGLGLRIWTGLSYIALALAASYVYFADRGLPVPVLLLGLVALAGVFLARNTIFGRTLYAIGGNEQAAVLSGLKVRGTKMAAYAVMGALCGIAAVVLSGRLNSATPTEGQLMELDAIASVVIGGTSLQGGVGTIVGSVIGAFIIGVMNNGMDLLEISSNWQMVMKGLIIILAVYIDARMRRTRVS